jgi:hypothetical protein
MSGNIFLVGVLVIIASSLMATNISLNSKVI